MRNCFSPKALLGTILAALVVSPAAAQLISAYEEGYRPLLSMSSSLKELADSDTKRQDFGAVATVGANYATRLTTMVASLENIGKNFRDGSNQTFAADARSRTLSAAKTAKTKAEALKAKGDAKADCKAQAIELQAALTELSDEFKTSWKMHEAWRQRLMDDYESVRSRWWDATKEDRRPVDDQAKRVASLREKRTDMHTRAEAAGKLYLAAQDQCDKARADLYRTEKDRTPDEVKRRYDDWCKAEDLVKRVAAAALAANKEAADAAKAHSDAEQELQRAWDAYTKEATEGDEMYKIVLQRHLKAFEMAQEYKPFSL